MMSVEQWGVVALFVLLPLLEGVARVRRAHAPHGGATGRVGEARTSQEGSSLPSRDVHRPVVVAAKPQPGPPPASRLAGSRSSYTNSASVEAHTTIGTSVAGDSLVQWLRPVRNLRHAIVVATILGPPPRP